MATARRVETSRGGHRYELDGRAVPGVTSVLGAAYPKPWLKAWALKFAATYAVDAWDALSDLPPDERVVLIKRSADAHRDFRGDVGRAVHAAVEGLLDDCDVITTPDAAPYVEQVAVWLAATQPTVLLSERPVFSRRHGYAGTFDAVLVIDGETWLVDWKTSPRVSDDYACQLAAYRYADVYVDADEVEHPMPRIDHTAVVHITPDACSLVPVDGNGAAYDVFLHCLALHDITTRRADVWVREAL